MKNFKVGMSDINEGILSGKIMGTPDIITTEDNRMAINFTISSKRFTSSGVKYFQYAVVVFSPYAEKVIDSVKDGMNIRVNYHLMSVSDCTKPVVDYLQIDE
jgi:hypothetical protein